MDQEIKNNLLLLQSYYKSLHLGKFIEQLIKNNDLSHYAKDFPIKTWNQSSFIIKASNIKKTLSDISKNKEKRNIFGYLTEINAFKWIFSITRELIDNNQDFNKFIETRLKDQAFNFEQIIRFARNVLNHTTTATIKLKEWDFRTQKDFLIKWKKIKKINLDFNYNKYIKERKWNKEYWIKVEVNFETLKEHESFFKIISLHNLYLLSELCFNLSEIFRVQYKIK